MTDKELRNLKRVELLEMLIAQVEENERLKGSLEEAQKALSDRQIIINEAGSIADAALQINGVYAVAQAAAMQYLENIQRLSGEQEVICRQMEADAQKKAEAICAEADAYSREVRSKADAYWKQISDKAMALIQDQKSLSALILQGGKGDLV